MVRLALLFGSIPNMKSGNFSQGQNARGGKESEKEKRERRKKEKRERKKKKKEKERKKSFKMLMQQTFFPPSHCMLLHSSLQTGVEIKVRGEFSPL